MPLNTKNQCLTFQNIFATNGNENKQKQTEKIQDEEKHNSSQRSILSTFSNLNETKRAFRSGAEKISKTFSDIRISINEFTQMFRASTKRRQILEEGPMTPYHETPSYAKRVLGRTPTKLYSPFGIETPVRHTSSDNNKENVPPHARKSLAKEVQKLATTKTRSSRKTESLIN